jgi:hypothetical protein
MINKESLAYELGVLLYNLTEETFSENYDKIGNFSGIMNSLNGKIQLDDLADGFFAEAANNDMDFEEAQKRFKKAKQDVDEY